LSVAHLFDVACRPVERRRLLETLAPVRMMFVALDRDQRLDVGGNAD
jgi:hypothetical protein